MQPVHHHLLSKRRSKDVYKRQILFFTLAPERAAKPLQAAQGWLDRHNRVIVIAVSFVFGLWFFYSGITGLTG